MKETVFTRAGSALVWQAAQHLGVKAIFLVRLLILARLLSPDDFGLLAIASVAIDVLLRLTNFGMVPALVQRLEAEKEHYDVAWTVGMVRALTIASITVLAAPMVAQFFAEPRATAIIRVLAIRPLVDAAASIKVAELTRCLDFRSLAFMELPKALANTCIAVALAPRLGIWALVAGTIAGPVVYLIVSYLSAPYRPKLSFDLSAAQALIRFGRWVFLTSLVAMAGQSMLRLIVGRQLGAIELGRYYLAASLAFLPADVASQVVGQVAFPFYSRLQKDVRQATVAFRSTLITLSALLLPALALLIALAPSLVDSVLGSRWTGTAPIIRVLALANVIGLFGDTIVPILRGAGRPDKILVIEVTQSSLLISLAWVFADRYGVVGVAAAWLPALVASQIVSVVLLHQILPRPFAGLGVPMSAIATSSLVAAIIALLVGHIVPGLVGFVLAGLLGMVLTVASLWSLERRFALGLLDGLVLAFPRAAALVGLGHGQTVES